MLPSTTSLRASAVALRLMALASARRAPEFRLPNTDPWNSLEPDLVTTDTMPPVEKPYSGMKEPVLMSISWTKLLRMSPERLP